MKVLLTGATGSVGSQLRPFLAEDYDTILLNGRSSITDLRNNEHYQQGDVCDPNVLDSLISQVDAIIHLAGLVGPDYTFEETLGPNFISVYHLFEKARKYGIKRIIYASTNHAVGFLKRGTHIDHSTAPRADGWYGITKACGEIIASYASDKYGMDIMCIRIGNVSPDVIDERRLHTWCSPRDLAALIKIGLTGPQRGFQMVYGCSNCPDPIFDNSYAYSLGYKPLDNSLDHASQAIIEELPDPENVEQIYVGGYFAMRKNQ